MATGDTGQTAEVIAEQLDIDYETVRKIIDKDTKVVDQQDEAPKQKDSNMDSKLEVSRISVADFDALLAQYDSVLPDKLRGLDEERMRTIPETLGKRRDAGDAYLTKDEVVRLVEWKL